MATMSDWSVALERRAAGRDVGVVGDVGIDRVADDVDPKPSPRLPNPPSPAATPMTTPPMVWFDPAVTFTEPDSFTVAFSMSAAMVEVIWL